MHLSLPGPRPQRAACGWAVTKAFSLFSSSVSLIFSWFTFPSAAPLLTVVNVQSHLRARGVGGRPRAGRPLALHTDRAGGLSCVKEAGEWAARGGEGGAPTVSLSFFFFLRWLVILHSCSSLGCPGLGGPCSSEQGRAGVGREGKAAGRPGGGEGRAGGTQGWLLG